jgi:hypothetical protein
MVKGGMIGLVGKRVEGGVGLGLEGCGGGYIEVKDGRLHTN